MQGAQTESRLRGIGRQARMLAKTMIAHGTAHDIAILLNSGLTENLDELRQEFLDVLPPGSIKLFDIPGDVAESDPANLWRMRAAELMREAFLSNLKPDVVHLSSLFEGINDNAVTSVGLLQSTYATSVTLFDLIPLYDPAQYLGAPVAQRFYYRRAQSLKRADLLLAISESARREAIEMLSIPAERVEVALLAAGDEFHPVEMSQAHRAVLRAKFGLRESFILYVGAIEARKNVSLIIEAFSRMPASLQEATPIVFGGRILSEERLQLRAAACRFGVDPERIVFPGFIDESDLAALYGLCSVFVFPSTHEGFGLPPLEAMACGAPVLAARNSSLPEVMGRDDLMFGTFDADELAAKMQRILTDEPYAASIRRWGIEQAARFSWDATGKGAIESLERLHERNQHTAATRIALARRPRLAFFSPLPNDRSGVADFSAELLKELGRFYDIECIINGSGVDDPWIASNFVFRDIAFFRRHATSYDRVIYSIGNSVFHVHMFDLLELHPGVVILHDFFLSGIQSWLGNVGKAPNDDFVRELYLSHGLPALRHLVDEGREGTARRYPCNRLAFEDALGVILHSEWAVSQAVALYGPTIRRKLANFPLMRRAGPIRSPETTRYRLGFGPSEFIVCSFGFVADTKLSDQLLEAWVLSKAGRTPGSHLLFVGENGLGPWADALRSNLAALTGKVHAEVLGFVDPGTYDDYLRAADLAVQLRTNSRGETSRAVLDCMAAGLPVIVNAHGTAREIPDGTVLQIPDVFQTAELAAAIDRLFADKHARETLGAQGLEHIRTHHHPARVGKGVFDAIEAFYAKSDGANQLRLLDSMREMYAPTLPTEQDFTRVGRIMGGMVTRTGLRRILFDVTLLAEQDIHTGIERVVRSMLAQFLAEPPAGYRLELVRIEGSDLRFARTFVTRRFGIPANVLPDASVDYDDGDLYVMLEWAADRLPTIVPWLQRFRQSGGRVVIGINDLLPLIMPKMFPPFIGPVAERWFENVLLVADQLVCISRTVADDVLGFGNALSEGRNGPIAVDWYRCGHDIGASIPTLGMPANAAALIAKLKKGRTFLMVGTVEPRKGHMQVLQAFGLLWAKGIDVTLTIVGKKGWMVERVEKLITGSPEYGQRLHWFRDISDEFLVRLYTSSSALIAASEGEGFGLPLLEAASRSVPIIARDIPVFREVAGDHASYFSGTTSDALANAIERWLTLSRTGRVPDPTGMPMMTWRQSAQQLKNLMLADVHYGMIRARAPIVSGKQSPI